MAGAAPWPALRLPAGAPGQPHTFSDSDVASAAASRAPAHKAAKSEGGVSPLRVLPKLHIREEK